MANSADADQKLNDLDLHCLHSDPDLHCLQRQGISWFRRTRVKEFISPLRKHAYSNILKILLQKILKFSDKKF